MKIGVLGLGQAGGKIAQALYQQDNNLYIPLAVNLAKQDLESLSLQEHNKLHVRWKVQGAGRDTQVPYQALKDDDNQTAFLSKISDVFGLNMDDQDDYTFKVDYLLIAVGAGGGTGNGFLRAILDSGMTTILPPIGVVLATPREIDSFEEQKNTAELINVLNENLDDESIKSVFLINNDLYARHVESNWMDSANQHFSKKLTAFIHQTAQPSQKSVDEADLMKMLTRFGGYSSIETKIGTPVTVLDKIINGLQSNGFSVKTAKSIAVMTVGSQVEQSENIIMSTIRTQLPNTSEYVYTGFYKDPNLTDPEHTENYVMFAGMGMPDYLIAMVERLKDFKQKQTISSGQKTLDLSFLKTNSNEPKQKTKKEFKLW
ncbi:hypothetical protein LLE49_19830 [Alicyclobacillus tolerans]|uniref:hypothetical protein n=1 Tax=Alicyclobacillus tolerans TaxID=90970 RepID=UPI001F1BA709|nr:hypothetical protein [Alicyclobacillus tolerans]MCF8566974.1 hypothetical protein [Alicyclobacillus tolerans]